ncbi:MAG: HEPN domain-containing protein [Acidobacteria bacterium]|nr:HEPN domain-containing protein [Acidobacteriota bacterium]
MNRGDFQGLARTRLRESRALLKAGYYDGAYYLAGYAIECALKACIARKTRRYDFPDKQTVNDSYTHDLKRLVKLAGLELQRDAQEKAYPGFKVNWDIVKDWTEESRYRTSDRKKAQDLYSAIAGRRYGVLSWLRKHW